MINWATEPAGNPPAKNPTEQAIEYLTRAAHAIAAASRVTKGAYAIALGRCADVVEQAKRELGEQDAKA